MLSKSMKRGKTDFVSISYGEKVVSVMDILQKIHPNMPTSQTAPS